MSAKFNRSGSPQSVLTASGAAAKAFPNADWVVGVVIVFDGPMTGYGAQPQYICSTGPYQSAGSFNFIYEPSDSNTAPGKVHLFLDTTAAAVAYTNVAFVAGKAYGFVVQHSNGVVSMRHCPVLAAAPTDASAVIAGSSDAFAVALTGSGNFTLGNRSDLADRAFGQSMAHFFRLDGATMTDLEVAKFAYGMSPAEMGKATSIYIRMNDRTDMADTGTQANTFSATPTTITSGTAPGFGYSTGGGNPAPATVDAADQLAERVYQRINDVAVVGSSGTWTGPTQPTSIEYQFVAVDGATVIKAWAALNATITAGNSWTASTLLPKSPNGKKHFIQYRSKDSSGNVLATSAIKTNRFGVGDIHGFIGSSSAEKAFYADSGTGFTPDYDTTSRYDGAWNTITAGCAIQIASSLAVQSGVPIAFLDYGIGGSVIGDWNNAGYSQWLDFTNGVASVGGKLAGCAITVGSNDAAYGQVASRAAHAANLRTLVIRVRTLTGQPSLPACLIGFNRRTSTNVSAAAFAACSDYVRMAENDVGDDAGIYSVQTLDFSLSSDGIHLDATNNGFPAWGRRIAYVYGAAIYGGTYRRGPKISQMSLSGNVVVVTLAHRGSSDFTPTSGITGFAALDSAGAAIAINAAVRTSATTITLTCASAPARVQYLEGGAPEVGTPVFGNTATALPMTVETDMTLAAQLATTVNFSVVDGSGAVVTGLVNLDYAFYDQPRISAGTAPVKYGTTISVTNGIGSISIAGVTSLAPGGIGRIEFGDSAVVKAAIGLVAVS